MKKVYWHVVYDPIRTDKFRFGSTSFARLCEAQAYTHGLMDRPDNFNWEIQRLEYVDKWDENPKKTIVSRSKTQQEIDRERLKAGFAKTKEV